MSGIADVLFDVHGDCVRAGCGYPLWGAIKSALPDLASCFDLRVGEFEHVSARPGGYLHITPRTRLRMRCTIDVVRRLLTLEGERLRVGAHIIVLGSPSFEVLRPEGRLWCSAFYASNTKPGADRSGWLDSPGALVGYLTNNLRLMGAPDARITVGRKRLLHMGRHPAHAGYAVALDGLTPEVGLLVQQHGIGVDRPCGGAMRGARAHMGSQMWLVGRMPAWCQRGDDRDSDRGSRAPARRPRRVEAVGEVRPRPRQEPSHASHGDTCAPCVTDVCG